MNCRTLLIATLASTLYAGVTASAAPDLDQLLKKSDAARSGSSAGMTWKIELVSEDKGTHTESTFLVKTKGGRGLVEALSPPRSKGEIYLFQDRLLWFFKPGMSRPVSLSTRQRLSGQASNGDIAYTNYAGDYNPTYLKDENVDGVPCHMLLLEAKGKDTTYDKINYWISKTGSQGLKAEFLALDGTVMKKGKFKYGQIIKVNGKNLDFVKEMHIEDAQNSKNFSTMRFSTPKTDKHSDSIFNVNNLRR